MKKSVPKAKKPARKLRVVKKIAKVSHIPKLPEISKDIQDLYAAMRCIATAHNLLDTGYFKHTQAQAVSDSLVFLKSLHGQVKEKAFADPQCDLIPDLKELKEKELKQLMAEKEASKVSNVKEEGPKQEAIEGSNDAA